MKFQNPNFIFFLNRRTDKRTNGRTDKPKAICSPLFQVGGIIKYWNRRNLTPLGKITIIKSLLGLKKNKFGSGNPTLPNFFCES